MPEDILKEYYLALERYTLEQDDTNTTEKFAAAKYLALAQTTSAANMLFDMLLSNGELSPLENCDTQRWLAWSQDADISAEWLPPGPLPDFVPSASCEHVAIENLSPPS